MRVLNLGIGLMSVGVLAGCGEAAEGESFGAATDALETAPDLTTGTLEKKCGMQGRIIYASTCADLKAECAGTFTCADPVASRDGECASWGECNDSAALVGVEPEEIDVRVSAQLFVALVPSRSVVARLDSGAATRVRGGGFERGLAAPPILPEKGKGSPLPAPGSPGGISAGSGKLKEVDIAHIGGIGATNAPLFVTVAGTGSAGVLASWRSQHVGDAPKHLYNSPNIVGHNHQLRVLRAFAAPNSRYETLVSAVLKSGSLWLTTWRVAPDGKLTQLDSRGYGSNRRLEVTGYSLAHRVIGSASAQRFQLLTPVLHSGGKSRVVTWEINGASGQISGKFDSSDTALTAAESSDLSASPNAGDALTGPHYVVALSNDVGRLAHTLWDVTDAGEPSLLDISVSGTDIRNVNSVSQRAENLALAPVNGTGHLSAVNDHNGQLRLAVWEDSSCIEDNCTFEPSSVSDSTRDVAPDNPGVQQSVAAFPTINTQNVLLRDPVHQSDLFAQNPDVVQAIASVRKVMVTVVALDAIAAGDASFDDMVTVSAAAANVNNTGASKMGLQAGEQIPLRDLLYGNMMVSAGDATWAVSEHVAGSISNMLTRMNNKANELGMSNTFHCQRGSTFSGVAYSSARDQVTLWESVYENALFMEIAGKASEKVCGTLPNNTELCHPVSQNNPDPIMTNNMTRYPNLDGFKPGGGGGLCNDLPQYATTPTCLGGGCLAVQTTRLGRALIAAEFQPNLNTLTATPWTDARRLFDFGFREIFTPDYRGDSGAEAGTASDFAIDKVDDLHAVSAALTGGSALTFCNWAPDVQDGSVEKTVCTTRNFNGLAPSPRTLPATRLDVVKLSSLLADNDYLLGRLEGSDLSLQMWRVGQHN